MKGFGVLSFALAASIAVVSANHFVYSNGTHFHDDHSNKTIKHFGCDIHSGHASQHFLNTIKKLHDQHKNSNIGTRAAVPAAKQRKPVHKKQTPAASPTDPSVAVAPAAASSAASSPAAGAVQASISVPTYFHVISTTANAGTITQAMADAQMATMNQVYNQYGISFNLVNTSFTTNDAWAIAAGSDMDNAKAALRAGTYANLNLYFHTDLSGGNLGTCTLPSQVPPGAPASTYVSDGCNVNANTMPGGTMMGYNQGMTAVHETGHWLGLLHTFEGYACTGDGDYIVDTRAEAQSTNGCPTDPAKNTCPTLDGVDPIHNYMDYSTDACYEAFTSGQIARISSLWSTYRKDN